MSDVKPRREQYADDETYNKNLRESAEKIGVLKREEKKDAGATAAVNQATKTEDRE